MKRVALLLLVALLLGADVPRANDASTENTLDGTWRVISIRQPGGNVNEADEVLVLRGGRMFPGETTYRMWPAANPPALDWIEKRPGGDVLTQRCIYNLRGDVLTVCMEVGEFSERPTTFIINGDRPVYIFTLKRIGS